MNAGDLCRKANATGARNTTGHVGFDERTKIKIFGRTLWFAEPAEVNAVGHRLVLQIAFAALVADRAIQRVVDEQKLHHPFTGLFDHRGIGLHNRRLAFWARAQIAHLHGTRCSRFWRAADDLNQAHPTVSCDGKAFVVAEARDLNPRLFTSLNEGHGPINFNLVSIDDDFAQIGHWRAYLFPGWPRPNGVTTVLTGF